MLIPDVFIYKDKHTHTTHKQFNKDKVVKNIR